MQRYMIPALIFGCSNSFDPVETGTIPVDGDADTDADSDTDADVDTDTGPQLDCAAVYDTPVPGVLEPDDVCVTERVYCGDIRFGTTEGGSEIYDWDFWHINQAVGNLAPEDVAGAERIYVIEGILPQQYLHMTIESCDDVRASWYVSGDITDYCYTGSTNTPKQHFNSIFGRIQQETLIENNTTTGAYKLQVIIDAEANANTNYLIRFECGP